MFFGFVLVVLGIIAAMFVFLPWWIALLIIGGFIIMVFAQARQDGDY